MSGFALTFARQSQEDAFWRSRPSAINARIAPGTNAPTSQRDSHLILETAIRPTAVGKKNWMFVGSEDTGERSAILYTIIESAKRHGHAPYGYLHDLLERLRGMKSLEIGALLPKHWQPVDTGIAPTLAAS